MRLAVIADIHGNFRALQAVLADLATMEVDRIVSLGDNIGYGPEPEEVVRELIRHRIVSVLGNHELALVNSGYRKRLHAVARDSLALSRALLSPASLHWLAGLPTALIDDGARFVHGCPPQSATVYLHAPTETRLRNLFATYPEPICFAGHTHDLDLHSLDGDTVASVPLAVGLVRVEPEIRYLILPGSVGQPRDPFGWQAKYVVWDRAAATIEVRAVAYDVHTTIRLLGERGFPASNAKRLYW